MNPMPTTAFPTGATNEPRTIEKSSVERIIRESAPALSAKPKRGRPRKSVLPSGSASAGNGEKPDLLASGSERVSSGESSVGNESMAGPGIPVEALTPAIRLPFGLVAARTGFDGWALSEEEAKSVAPLVDAVMRRYLPSGPSKHGEAVALAVTLTAFTGMRLMAYYAWLGEKDRAAQKPGKEPEPQINAISGRA